MSIYTVSIHALLAECDVNPRCRMTNCYLVSIHALLAECDCLYAGPPHRRSCFNPRTPCGVRRLTLPPPLIAEMFQSTHSLRSATPDNKRNTKRKKGFNPRTPCGVRRVIADCPVLAVQFQSTHSLRSATRGGRRTFPRLLCFNPRTPCGVRPVAMQREHIRMRFQSTHSLRSATSFLLFYHCGFRVSIHALLAECDKILFIK